MVDFYRHLDHKESQNFMVSLSKCVTAIGPWGAISSVMLTLHLQGQLKYLSVLNLLSFSWMCRKVKEMKNLSRYQSLGEVGCLLPIPNPKELDIGYIHY